MPHTVRLFDEDSHLSVFTSPVLSCTPGSRPHEMTVVLEKTAFFPEGGGQYADEGTLGGCPVTDVQEKDGVIYHTVCSDTDEPFRNPSGVVGRLNAPLRFVRMQNHSGEHIVSGLIFRRFGFHNVGFHLGNGDVTLDFDGEIDRATLDEIEDEANRIVYACLPVRAFYPSPEALSHMEYRSKKALTGPVRIVEIGDFERCACCAPHVRHTGEIGIIKLLDAIRYKGGVRIHMLAGSWALADYRRRYTSVSAIAADLSVRQEDVVEGFRRLREEEDERKGTIASLRRQVGELTVQALTPTDGSLCLFREAGDAHDMQNLLNRAVGKCGRLCGVFAGNDADGYRFVIGRGSEAMDLKIHMRRINEALRAKGGGSSEMLQGRASASRKEIEAFFRSF